MGEVQEECAPGKGVYTNIAFVSTNLTIREKVFRQAMQSVVVMGKAPTAVEPRGVTRGEPQLRHTCHEVCKRSQITTSKTGQHVCSCGIVSHRCYGEKICTCTPIKCCCKACCRACNQA